MLRNPESFRDCTARDLFLCFRVFSLLFTKLEDCFLESDFQFCLSRYLMLGLYYLYIGYWITLFIKQSRLGMKQ
jgi:hypothetical protein